MKLNGPGADAEEMCRIARLQGFQTSLLTDEQATLAAFRSRVKHAADVLEAGDILLMTFSGHGNNIRIEHWSGDPAKGRPGCSNPPVEKDGRDEKLCFYDGELIDNEIYSMWCKFNQGVKIVLIADSCLSGTLNFFLPVFRGFGTNIEMDDEPSLPSIPDDDIQPDELHDIPPTVLLISASHDDSTTKAAGPGERNSKFTQGLLKAWEALGADDTYVTFYSRIVQEAMAIQPRIRPNFAVIGRESDMMSAFKNERPFSIQSPTPLPREDSEQPDPGSEPGAMPGASVIVRPARDIVSPYRPKPFPQMEHATLTVTVAMGSPDGATTPITNAPVILFNSNMTINRVVFTEEKGGCAFVAVPPGQYFILATDPPANRYRMFGQFVAELPVDIPVCFPEDPDNKGKIKVTVQVGGSTASGRLVKLYVAGGSTPIVQQPTDSNGECLFFGLFGAYDVEVIANSVPGCSDRRNAINVPLDDNTEVRVDFSFPSSCS